MKDDFKKKVLKNGITLLFEKREVPVVAASITNPYGGAYDKGKTKGMAHFIEHLLFTGTENRSHEDISREIEKKGGVLNAGTYNEMTSYYFKMPSEHLFSGLDILTDMLNNPKFDEAKFEKEKKVIFEEIKMIHDFPMRDVWKLIEENLHEGDFGKSNLGSVEDLTGLKRDFVAKEYEKLYDCENYIVSIVGDADFGEICDYFEKNFKSAGNKISEVKPKKIFSKGVDERKGLDQAQFILGMHAPHPGSHEFAVLSVLDAYIGDGMSSKLFLEIREKRGLAYAIKSASDPERNSSSYAIYVGTTKENIEEVEKLIVEEFNNVKDMVEKDLKEAKQRVLGLKHISSEDSSEVMMGLVFAELSGGAEKYYDFDESVKKVTLDEVKKLSKSLVKSYSTAAIVPE